jgi:hypothetical protein
LMLALQPGFYGIKASSRGRHVQAFPRMSWWVYRGHCGDA